MLFTAENVEKDIDKTSAIFANSAVKKLTGEPEKTLDVSKVNDVP